MSALNQPRGSSGTFTWWRGVVLAITVLFGALSTAIALVALSALQLSSPGVAQPLLGRVVEAILEIDHYVETAWPTFEAAAQEGETIQLVDLPLPLELDAAALADGPRVVADEITAAAAELMYRDGIQVVSDWSEEFDVVLSSEALDRATEQSIADARGTVTVLLTVSGVLALILAVGAAAQLRGLWRFCAAALSLGLGAGIVWVGATLARSLFTDRAMTTLDLFEAEMWLIAADGTSLFVRNAAIVGISCAVVLAAAAAGGLLLRLMKDGEPNDYVGR